MSVDWSLAYERFGVLLLAATIGAGLASSFGRRAVLGAAAALPLLLLVPLPGASGLGFALGFVGALGGASLVLLGALLARAFRPEAGRAAIDRRLAPLAILVLPIGLAFYPPVLGLGPYDPYRLGFYGLALPFLLVALLAFAWFRRAALVAVWLALTALLALAQIHPSANLWDQLIDPIAVILAAIVVIATAIRRFRRVRG